MQITSKSMLVIMGICIGLIFFGINTALINFNRLVIPEQPLVLLNCHTAGDELEINIMGETLRLSLDSSTWLNSAWPQKLGEQAGELYSISRDEINHCLAPVQQRVWEAINRP